MPRRFRGKSDRSSSRRRQEGKDTPRRSRARAISAANQTARREGPAALRRGARKETVGIVRVRHGDLFLEPLEPESATLRLERPEGAHLRDRDVVVAKLKTLARAGRAAIYEVDEVLGRFGDPGVDTLIVARKHHLAKDFPEDALAEAARLPEAPSAADLAKRERFDDPAPVTIDGETARDFDDAIAVAPLPKGGFRLFVHIADVGHFVRAGSALDREARRRGTSVYFPDRVIPMFPERLSNDLCSLRPNEDRLVQSVVLDLTAAGEITSVRFADGVIKSAARLTYTQVAAVLDGEARLAPALDRMLASADKLRRVLEERRHARGSVDFDLPEPQILLDVEGAITGITIRPRNRAHRLIEEFMLIANEAVAGYLEAKEAPCLYRVHETPDPDKIAGLAEFAESFGARWTVRAGGVRPRDVQRLLEAVEGRPEYPLLAQVALRSMKQARYTTENLGHFGLAAPVYAHFTSPIRRYPDLVDHRLLRTTRRGRKDGLAKLAQDLEETGEECSRLEREAEAAERELLELKKIEFVRERVGEVFEGIVTTATRFGLFVQLADTYVEGLLHVARLDGDRYYLDEKRHELRGMATGRRFRMGDRVPVVLERVDPVLRRVDLALAQPVEGAPTEARRGRKAGGRKERGRKASEPRRPRGRRR